MDYADKLPPSPWYIFAPPRRYIFTPPLTIDLLRPRRNLRLREVLDRRADHVGGLAEPEIEAGHPVGSHCAIYSRHSS